MSEQITLFRRSDLPADCSRIEIVNIYGDIRSLGFEITCIHCGIKSNTPQLITHYGQILCPGCHEEL